jgi:hypothetical protein
LLLGQQQWCRRLLFDLSIFGQPSSMPYINSAIIIKNKKKIKIKILFYIRWAITIMCSKDIEVELQYGPAQDSIRPFSLSCNKILNGLEL